MYNDDDGEVIMNTSKLWIALVMVNILSMKVTCSDVIFILEDQTDVTKYSNLPVNVYSFTAVTRPLLDSFKSAVIYESKESGKMREFLEYHSKSINSLHQVILISPDNSTELANASMYFGNTANNMMISHEMPNPCVNIIMTGYSRFSDVIGCFRRNLSSDLYAVIENEEDRLEKKTEIRIAHFNYAPFSFLGNGKDIPASGIEVRLLKSIAESMGLKAKFGPPKAGGLWGDAKKSDYTSIWHCRYFVTCLFCDGGLVGHSGINGSDVMYHYLEVVDATSHEAF